MGLQQVGDNKTVTVTAKITDIGKYTYNMHLKLHFPWKITVAYNKNVYQDYIFF